MRKHPFSRLAGAIGALAITGFVFSPLKAAEDALRSAGSDPGTLRRAMADAATWEAVKAEHDSAVNDKGAFGVPTIALDGGDGPAIFGPIVCDLPDDESARELWSHVRWLIANDSFAELKRGRPRRPDFAKHGGGDTARAA